MSKPKSDWRERFWPKVDIGDCWEWTAGLNQQGYGQFRNGRTQFAHRFLWQELVGPIADGMTLDHLCRNRRCVNPDHLEVVTHVVNMSRAPRVRKQFCKWGHLFDELNTRIDNHGKRRCRECHQRRGRESYQRRLRSPMTNDRKRGDG